MIDALLTIGLIAIGMAVVAWIAWNAGRDSVLSSRSAAEAELAAVRLELIDWVVDEEQAIREFYAGQPPEVDTTTDKLIRRAVSYMGSRAAR